MLTSTLVPVDEYLRSSWHPDREYVDGAIAERNLGDLLHSWLQTRFCEPLRERGLHPFVNLRTGIKPNPVRVPDVLALRERPSGRILKRPPHIVVEILSPEDRIGYMADKIDDYLDFGIPNIWVVDPVRRAVSSCTRAGSQVFTGEESTSDGLVSIPLDEIFRDMPEIADEEEQPTR